MSRISFLSSALRGCWLRRAAATGHRPGNLGAVSAAAGGGPPGGVQPACSLGRGAASSGIPSGGRRPAPTTSGSWSFQTRTWTPGDIPFACRGEWACGSSSSKERRPLAALGASASYSDIYAYVAPDQSLTGELQLELQRLGKREQAAEARQIHEQQAQIAQAMVARRPAAEIKTQFADFDKLWHPFATPPPVASRPGSHRA